MLSQYFINNYNTNLFMKNTFLFVFSLFTISCSTNVEKKHKILVEKFPIEKQITLDTVRVEPVLFCIGDMLIMDDFLVTVDLKNDVFFQFFALPSLNYIGASVHKGGGPKEEIGILPYLGRIGRNSFTYRSIDKQKVVSYNMRENELSLVNEYKIANEYMSVLNSFLIGNKLLGYDMVGESQKEYISYDWSTHMIEEFGSDYPEMNFPINTKKKNMLFSKIMNANSDNRKFVALYDKLPLMRIYDDDGHILSESEYINNQLEPSIYGSDNLENSDLSSLTINYLKVKVTDRFIYGLYSGKTHGELGLLNTSDLCNEIHVWSWDGMPVKRFILNKPISNFAVSLDNSYILLYSFKEDDVLYKMNCN